MNKILTTTAAIALLLGSTITSQADILEAEDFSATATVASDYRYRGISLTQTDPSIGGEFRYDNDLVYVSVGGDSIDLGPFDGPNLRATGAVGLQNEMDFGFGEFTSTIGVEYVTFLNEPSGFADLDYYEFNLGADTRVGALDLGGSVYYAPDYFNTGSDARTFEGRAGVHLLRDFRLSGTVGQVNVDVNGPFDQWYYYEAGIGTNLYGFDLELAYVGNDIETDTVPSWFSDSVDDGFVFRASRTF